MPHFICATCGTQYGETREPPGECSICNEPRQFVNWGGQQWTTLDQLRRSHRNTIQQQEPGLISIGVEPSFGIGQRALLLRHPQGNVLWDCVALPDPGLLEMIQTLGGLAAIAISHPHYYTTMIEWARAFDARVLLHAADRQWVMRPDACLEFWEGDTRELPGGLTLVCCGGHFDGGTVLHWPGGAGGQGVLLSGDIIQVVQDRRWASFMYSFPNLIPLPAASVRRIVEAIDPFSFDRIYGAFWGKVIASDAKAAVKRSAERYIRALGE